MAVAADGPRLRGAPAGNTRRKWWLLAAVAATLVHSHQPASRRVVDQSAVRLWLGGAVPGPLPVRGAVEERGPCRGPASYGRLAGRAGHRCSRPCLLPVRLVEEAAPDWRLVSWALARGRGRALSLRDRLCRGPAVAAAFPVSRLLFPGGRAVAGAAGAGARPEADAVRGFALRGGAQLVGHPAVQHGNVIQISSGSVGVEEACSGVRSCRPR